MKKIIKIIFEVEDEPLIGGEFEKFYNWLSKCPLSTEGKRVVAIEKKDDEQKIIKLKTLKDIEDLDLLFSERKKLEDEFLEWAKIHKAEISPLNVITWIIPKLFNLERGEAINWIKYYEKQKEKYYGTTKLIEKSLIMGFNASQEALKHFFNITEEDLR